MNQETVNSVIKSLDIINNPKTTGSLAAKLPTKVLKPQYKRHKHHENPTIKYFQSISARRVRSSPSPNSQVLENGSISEQESKSEYLPFSRDKLYQRISTFQKLTNWNITHSKQFNPLIISLHGWKCDTTKLNCIKCDVCNHTIFIKLAEFGVDENEDEELIESINTQLISKYLDLLTTGHGDNCAWKKQWCPDTLYDIRFENLTSELLTLKTIYTENLRYKQDERVTGLEIDSNLQPDELLMIQTWLGDQMLEYDGKLAEMSILGWRIVKEDNTLLLKSESDARRLLLTKDSDKINLLNEHHEWSNYTEGYKVLLKMLKTTVEQREFNIDDIVKDQEGDEDSSASPSDSNVGTVDQTLERLEKLKKSLLL